MDRLYGLIFDVDGVIADTEGANAEASIKVFEEMFGITGVKREDFEAGIGRGAQAYVRAAAEVHGLEMTGEQVEQATRMRQENFLTILREKPLSAFGGVLELMTNALARDDFKVAIATSSTREKSEAVLKSARIPYERMAYVTGDQVKNKKPDPELFFTAAERIGIAAGDCVVIEDAPNGVEAAKAAGARCIAVTNTTTKENLDKADLICKSLNEIDLDTVMRLIDAK
ncbi:MAG: HAD family hydrolase [Planctomycetota bacterium]|jgi:HAD superfamily hydrolase (TIGR01509 family)